MSFQLETEHLLLRPMGVEDVTPLLAVFGDPEVMRFYPFAFTEQNMREWIERMQARAARDGIALLTMILRETGEVIGDCGLLVQEVDDEREWEIGYHVRRDLWGRGYATEAACACRDYGLGVLGRSRLVSLIHPDNRASQRVAEKVGMRLERETVWWGKPTRVYAMTAPIGSDGPQEGL